MFSLRDVPWLFWRMLTASPASEYRASLELCRQRNGDLLAERAVLRGKVEVLEEELRALLCVMAVRELDIPKFPGEPNG